jgi:GNAT superfamily N-acetyltransferase
MRLPTRVWYLELSTPASLKPAASPAGVDAVHAEVPLGALNSFFYEQVGAAHHWVDLLSWTEAKWQAFAEQVETWIAWERGTPAGYAELLPDGDGAIDIAHFGLLPPFQGRGIGGHLLTAVTQRAWALGPRTVTLNTCELDGERALPNYLARGFEIVREVSELRERPE